MSGLLASTAAGPVGVAHSAATEAPAPRGRGLPATVKVAAALVAVYLLTLMLTPGTGAAAAMTNLSFALFPALAAVACWTGARSLPAGQRRTWQLVGVAMATYACG